MQVIPTIDQEHPAHDLFDDSHLRGSLYKKARMGFIRKVFGIVSAELIITILWVSIVKRSETLTQAIQANEALTVLSVGLAVTGVLLLAFCRRLARMVPINYIILGITTLAIAYSTSVVCLGFPGELLMIAACATAAPVIGFTWYATTTTTEYHFLKALMYSSMSIIIVQLLALACLPNQAAGVFLSLVFSITHCFSIFFNIEAIIGESKDRYYTNDEYICASMNLYIEIVNLFIEILKMLHKLSELFKD